MHLCSIIVPFQIFVLLRAVEATSDTPDPVEAFPPFDQAKATVYRYRQQQGVNLGSWFVHENWITSSVFGQASGRKISEIDIASGSNARAVLEDHWDSFLDKDDFQSLANIGINTIRLPLGYWNLGPSFCQNTSFEPYASVYTNAWSHVVRAINWAGDVGIGVLVDLHGAPGSQNGQPHSGISDGIIGLFNNEANEARTLDVLTYLAQQLSSVSNVVGLQILNEPQDCDELLAFYNRTINAIRQVEGAENLPLYIHDGFNLQKYSDYVAQRRDFVVQDHHSYFVFTPSDDKKSASAHTQEIKTSISDSLTKAAANQRRNLIIGEWSCALTPQSLSQDSDESEEDARRNFCLAQLETYSNATAGWTFWTYKTDDCDTDPACRNPPGSFLSDLFPRDLDMKPSIRHRAQAIHYRRGNWDTSNTTAEERSSGRGYMDGFSTARLFCSAKSQLGFTEQLMLDNMKDLGSQVIAPGTESDYSSLPSNMLNRIQRYARLLLFDSRYFWWLAAVVILGDFLLSQLIVRFVAYTEIDWETYMVQTDVYLKGELDYSRITGPTGPLVYPAGHLHIHWLLHALTDAGKNIPLAQQIYAGLYILSPCPDLHDLLARRRGPQLGRIAIASQQAPAFHLLSAIIQRLLGRDAGFILKVLQIPVADNFQSTALSVKMSILLYLPALLVCLFMRHGLLGTLRHMVTLAAFNALLALQFLEEDYWAYLRSAFDLSRVFLFKWTVNWRMVGEETFLSSQWANGLLLGHISCLVAFGLFIWCKKDGGVWMVLKRGLRKPEEPASPRPLTADYIATILFTSNLIGIIFARSLHYQFYSWYAQQLPFLAWRTRYPIFVKIALIGAIEYSWNIFPSTPLSSTVLLVANTLLLSGIWTGYPNGLQ
ncbi:putative dolichyl-phosphate-mannose--glycolipid alpha-mannosyltransferase [Mycena sanguinolenta]|uniref:Dol-P-Man:Man(5)GlcNAc(2)-PP-Dol alpha-1,3-mannosyltransferase n=1 Tax=Mycena sanguinolenta TaxID=230812 RepID=A0A8H7D5S2_9AGAR|nr:putative dolichyl-phosphate-mannose--glycolipid alpha-mannosyltransferase [Mycena sanguinolenta]